MDFMACYSKTPAILMEGALGERLKREYGICFDETLGLAGLVYDPKCRAALTSLWNEYIGIADEYQMPLLVTTPTRRANRDRVSMSAYDGTIIADNIRMLQDIRRSFGKTDMYVGGLMGCKGDAYSAQNALTEEDAYHFHSWQANLFKEAGADFLLAGIMPAVAEAAGMAKAMEETGLAYIISFMIRRNGKLIDGTTIHDAILQIDNSVSRKPVCYMTNCVHPQVLYEALSYDYNRSRLVKERFCGIQPNTSSLSPEELDGSAELISSGSAELAEDVLKLRDYIQLKIVGGCCGTDASHIRAIAGKICAAGESRQR